MNYFKDTVTGQLYAFDDDVTVTQDTTTKVYSFSAIDVVQHPEQRVLHEEIPAVMNGDEILVPAVAAFEAVIPAWTESIHRCQLNYPQTLQPVTDEEVADYHAALQTEQDKIPKIDKFVTDAKAAFGGMSGLIANPSLPALATLFFSAVTNSNWEDVQELITAAKAANLITKPQYTALKSAANANNIPITL